jgi:hypothetical protein
MTAASMNAAASDPPEGDIPATFADPDWRGDQHDPLRDAAPTASLVAQALRLESWIRGGACYGWLDTYQARRAAFELQSIRAQLKRLSADDGRCAIQSRLDRLDRMLRSARGAAWSTSTD